MPPDAAAKAQTLSPVLPDPVEEAPIDLLRTACARDLRLATAESCTGGLLASLLTDIEGASHAFERGFVVYSGEAKCELIHVARQTLDCYGAVSRDVAIEMAEGALAASRADVALAITGFAGRGGPGDEPGLVHFGCVRRGRLTAHREKHFGDIGRGRVRIACMRVAISMMREALD